MTEPTPATQVELVADTTEHPQLKLVAIFLGAALLLGLVAITALAVLERSIPDVLQSIAVGALTALGTLLAGNRR
jgi:hypothetical protein